MATVRLYWRGKVAYIDWHERGERFRRSLGKLAPREAEKVRSQKEAELTHGVRIIARMPLLRDFLETWLDWYKAEHPTTHNKAKSELRIFLLTLGHRQIDTLRPIELEAYKTQRLVTDRMAPETVGKEVRRLQAALRCGVQWKELDANPFDGIQAPRGVRSVAVKFYSADAMKKLYAANQSRANLWRFMAHTGIRRGELMHLRHENAVAGRLLIESDPGEDGVGRTKSGKWREVPLNKHAKAALAKLPDPLVSVHKDTVSEWFTADAKLAGVGGSLHRLRHTFCAHMVIAGVPLRRVQLLAGHSDYATTEKYYAHLTPEGDDGAVRKLNF